MPTKKMKVVAVFMAVLSLAVIFFNIPNLTVETSAATLTSIGLAEHGLKAFNDGWIYVYGGAGEKTSSGGRQSDCSGLIHAYFTDNGTNGPRTVTQQVEKSVLHGSLDTIPRIHGLLVTMQDYDHVGIYIGDGMEVDNSDVDINMLKKQLEGRGWIMWHLLDAGIKYPVSGFYAFDGNMYHYSNFQYDVNKTITHDGESYTIGSDGIVCDSDGTPIPVDSSLPNEGFTAATNVVIGDSEPPEGTPATVRADSVRMRSKPSTSADVVATMGKGTTVYVSETIKGDSVTADGKTSNEWCKVETRGGQSGYISLLYIVYSGTPPVSGGNDSSPSIVLGSDFKVYMESTNKDAAIYYTNDCSAPSKSSTIYNNPIVNERGTTYRAISVHGDSVSKESRLTVLPSGVAFTDITTASWYYEFVESAILMQYFVGNGDHTFSPDSEITRAEFVSVLANTANEDISKYNSASFSDVNDSDWFASAVAWSEAKGYVAGFQDGCFRPNAKLTREQLCVIIFKYLSLENQYSADSFDPEFSDHFSISPWAAKSVYACRVENIVSGKGENRFGPLESATRAETATMLVQAFDEQ